jgi:cell division protein FtsL
MGAAIEVPYRFEDNENTATALERAAQTLSCAGDMARKITSLEAELMALRTELSDVQRKHADTTKELSQAAPYVGLQKETESKLCEALREIDDLKRVIEKQRSELSRAASEIHHLQRELVNERRGIPTDIEQALLDKDAALSRAHQQLAVLRTKVHHQQQIETEMKGKIKELETDLQLFEKSRSIAAICRRGASQQPSNEPFSASPVRSASRDSRNLSPRAGSPFSALRSPPSYKNQSRKNPPLHGLNEDIVDPLLQRMKLQNDILESELSATGGEGSAAESASVMCPHCDTALLCSPGEVGGKSAFCFSCRRSFTTEDLVMINAQQWRNPR